MTYRDLDLLSQWFGGRACRLASDVVQNPGKMLVGVYTFENCICGAFGGREVQFHELLAPVVLDSNVLEFRNDIGDVQCTCDGSHVQ